MTQIMPNWKGYGIANMTDNQLTEAGRTSIKDVLPGIMYSKS
jgi:hypothetical protein